MRFDPLWVLELVPVLCFIINLELLLRSEPFRVGDFRDICSTLSDLISLSACQFLVVVRLVVDRDMVIETRSVFVRESWLLM